MTQYLTQIVGMYDEQMKQQSDRIKHRQQRMQENLFRQADLDQSGTLDRIEFRHLLQTSKAVPQSMMQQASNATFASGSKLASLVEEANRLEHEHGELEIHRDETGKEIGFLYKQMLGMVGAGKPVPKPLGEAAIDLAQSVNETMSV